MILVNVNRQKIRSHAKTITFTEKEIKAIALSASSCWICEMLFRNIAYRKTKNMAGIVDTRKIIWDDGIKEHINQIRQSI